MDDLKSPLPPSSKPPTPGPHPPLPPPPWFVEQQEACFVIRDHSGQKLAYVYLEDEPGRRSAARRVRTSRATPVPPQRT